MTNHYTFLVSHLLLGLPLLFIVDLALASRYLDNNNGTVTDTTTGLTWMKCALGTTWTGTTCSGSSTKYTWEKAKTLSSTFVGYTDWRLPNIRELQTIVDLTTYEPAIDNAIFPNTYRYDIFWSSSVVTNQRNIRSVHFSFGYADDNEQNSTLSVRLVRGEQFSDFLKNSRALEDYVDNHDGTVTHKLTQLTWKRCAEGQIWNGVNCSGRALKYTWDLAMNLTNTFIGNGDWRVPTVAELISLVDYTIPFPGPTLNGILFPNTPSISNFWSSLVDASYDKYAWYVHFDNGNASNTYKNSAFSVRLVRDYGSEIGSQIIPQR